MAIFRIFHSRRLEEAEERLDRWEKEEQGGISVEAPKLALERLPRGLIPLGRSDYVAREADQRLPGLVKEELPGLLIRAPRHFGRTSILLRYLDHCERDGRSSVLVNCGWLAERPRDARAFILEFLFDLSLSLGVESSADPRPSGDRCRGFSQDSQRGALGAQHSAWNRHRLG